MQKILDILASETDGKSYHTMKYSYDSIGMPTVEYDDVLNRVMKWKESGETIPTKKAIPLKKQAQQRQELNLEPIFTYFLDGSRRVFKVDDIVYDKKVYPVVAGQIGIGCCRRANKKLSPQRFNRELVISLPDISFSGHKGQELFFDRIIKKVNDNPAISKLGIKFSKVLPYRTSIGQEDKLEDSAIAVIQDQMIELEKNMVRELVKEKLLNQNNYLLKDGSLEYKDMKTGDVNLRDLQKIKHNYEWVIGVSKSFNPECCLDHTGKSNSDYIADLPLYCRTPVAKYENEISGDVCFGVWYVRIRDKSRTKTPFDGVVKVEKIMMDREIEIGIDSEVVDLISAEIINERNPTCYGADQRWSNHLYPVYLTETYIKSRYLSEELFLSLF